MKQPLRVSLFAAALGMVVAPVWALRQDAGQRTLWLRFDPVVSKAPANLAKDVVESTTFDAKNRTLKVVLKPGVEIDKVARRFSQRRDVLEVRSSSGLHYSHENDLRSSSALTELIERIGGDEEEEREREKEREMRNRRPGRKFQPKSEEEDAGTEYLRSLRDYVKVRAYPYDRIDSYAYDRAVTQASKLLPAKIGAAASSSSKAPVGAALAAGISGKWKFVGPYNLNTPYQIYYGVRPSSGRVNAIAYDPKNTKIIYVGAPQGGVMKTTDGGVTWTAVGDNWGYNTVSSIAVDPNNSSIVYAGTGDFHGMVGAYTMGLMKSSDGGATWKNVGRSAFGTSAVSSIVIDPSNSQNICVSTGRGPDGVGRIWRSTNGGDAWGSPINVSDAWTGLSYSAADSSGKRALYAIGGAANLYRSDDKGATWTKLTSPATSNNFSLPAVAASQVDSKTAYVLSTADQKIFKTTNSGSSWTDITAGFPGGYNWSQGFYDWYIACYKDGSNDHLMVGLIDVVESPNGGTNWQSVGLSYTTGAKTHNDQHSFAANPTNPNEILIGNDGGLYKATGGSGKWVITGLSDKLGITQFYNAVFHPTDKNKILGGTQDNASPVSVGDLSRWENVGGGDGGFCAINPANPNIQFVTIYGFTVIMTKDNWKTSVDISPNIGNDASPFVTPIYQDPVRTQYLYGCTNFLWRYNITTNTWTPRLGGLQLSNGALIRAVAVAPSNGDVIYTGSDDGRLFVSTNAGTSWRNLNTASLPNRAITSISVNPTNANSILVGLSGTGSQHIVECMDTTSKTPVFTSRGGSGTTALPDVPLNAIERDPFKPDTTWYVGNDIGVFSTGDGGKTWSNATVPLGLPNVQVNSLNANSKTGLLSAATYGRGIWTIGLGSGGSLVPSGYSIVNGTRLSGDVKSLTADDSNALVVTSALVSGQGQAAAAATSFDVPGKGALLGLSFELSSFCTTASATAQIYVKNWRTGQYEILKSYPATTARSAQSVTITGTMSDYMSSGRKVEVVARVLLPTRFGNTAIKLNLDRVSASVTTND